MKTVFMFPGQGAQEVGMGRELAAGGGEFAQLYKQASEIVGYDLGEVCFQGPEEKLNRTEVSQPAIFVTSAVCLEALRKGKMGDELAGVEPEACVGLSLGEYTALYASGAIRFEEGLKLVDLRGRSMQEAAEKRTGTMVSILGLDEEGVDKLCQVVLEEGIQEEDGMETLLKPVNYNCPGQIVVSGSIRACERAAEKAEKCGALKAVPLKVAGAFHTKMMAPAAEKLGEALGKCSFARPRCKVVANVDGRVYDGAEEIPAKLMKQLVGAVRWQQSIEYLLDEGAERFVEIGPGRVLTGLVKKITRARKQKIEIINVSG